MISCITTTYNRPRKLKHAIESVQKQTFEDWEHIIVHDGPASDETKAVMAEYKDDKRVQFIETEKNHGNHTKPKNTGILASKGEYICYLDDDNEYLPTFMESLKLELELSGVDVVYGLERIFKDRNDERGSQAISFPFNAQLLLNRSYIDTNAVLHRRDAVFQVGGWDETLPRFADWNLFVRMAKAGLSFKQVPIYLTKYFMSEDSSAKRFPVDSWVDQRTGLTMFDPTWFNTAGCYIYGPWLGDDREEEKNPKVAIFTITYDRLEYTKKMYESLQNSTRYPFDLYVYDNGSKDGTAQYLKKEGSVIMRPMRIVKLSKENKGLTHASNACIDWITNTTDTKKKKTTKSVVPHDYQIIGKVDNDVEFLTQSWLEDFVDMWKKNHRLYMGPYPEGLVDHPGGPWRLGFATIGGEYVELTDHLSGLCAFIDAKAYKNFRWTDKFLHGQQDGEASQAFVAQGYSPVILPRHRVQHMDTTAGQQEKYPEYFERRKKEKTTQV